MAAFFDPTDALANKGFIVDIYHVPTGKSVKFKGWVKNFSDSYESNWNTEDAYGRMDPISTFQNTVRTLTIEWDVVAASTAEARKNMGLCELLFRMLYPVYDAGDDNASNLQQSPLFKLKYGNLISAPGTGASGNAEQSGLLGTLGGFEYSPDFDAGFFTPDNGVMYPQSIELSAEFQVLHNFPVGWAQGGGFRGPNGNQYPYGLQIEEATESPNVSEADRHPTGQFHSGDHVQNAPSGWQGGADFLARRTLRRTTEGVQSAIRQALAPAEAARRRMERAIGVE